MQLQSYLVGLLSLATFATALLPPCLNLCECPEGVVNPDPPCKSTPSPIGSVWLIPRLLAAKLCLAAAYALGCRNVKISPVVECI